MGDADMGRAYPVSPLDGLFQSHRNIGRHLFDLLLHLARPGRLATAGCDERGACGSVWLVIVGGI